MANNLYQMTLTIDANGFRDKPEYELWLLPMTITKETNQFFIADDYSRNTHRVRKEAVGVVRLASSITTNTTIVIKAYATDETKVAVIDIMKEHMASAVDERARILSIMKALVEGQPDHIYADKLSRAK